MRTFGSYLPTDHLATTGAIVAQLARRSSDSARAAAFVVKSFDAEASRPELAWVAGIDAARARFASAVDRHKRLALAGPTRWLPVVDSGEAAAPFVVTPLVGRSARKLVIWQARLSHYALLHVARAVVDGLLAVRRADGGTHGNMKLSNVFLAGEGPIDRGAVLLADPSPSSQSRAEADEVQDVGRLIESLALSRDAFAGQQMSYDDRQAWQPLGRDATRWREVCGELREGGCASLDQLSDALRGFRTRTTGWIGRGVFAGVATIGLGAAATVGVRYARFNDALSSLQSAGDVDAGDVNAFAEWLRGNPTLPDDPGLRALRAAQLNVAGADRNDLSLLTLEGSRVPLSPWHDYDRVLRIGAVKRDLMTGFKSLSGWPLPRENVERMRKLGLELAKVEENAQFFAGNARPLPDDISVAMRWRGLLDQFAAFQAGSGHSLAVKPPANASPDQLEPAIRAAWREHVADQQVQRAAELAKLAVLPIELPPAQAAAFAAVQAAPIGQDAFVRLEAIRQDVADAVAADRALFDAYEGLRSQAGDPVLSQLTRLLQAELRSSAIDLKAFAATCATLAKSDAWPALQDRVVSRGALAKLRGPEQAVAADRAKAFAAAFAAASTPADAAAALKAWPAALESLQPLPDEETAAAEAAAFAARAADVQSLASAAADAPAAAWQQIRDRLAEGKRIVGELETQRPIVANAAAFKQSKADLAAVNESLATGVQSLRQSQLDAKSKADLDAVARAQAERERVRLEAERQKLAQATQDQQDAIRKQAELERQAEQETAAKKLHELQLTQAREREQQDAIQKLRVGLTRQAGLIDNAAMRADYESAGANAFADVAQRQRWVDEVGPYLAQLAKVPIDPSLAPELRDAAEAVRRDALKKEVGDVRRSVATNAWQAPARPADRMAELVSDWSRRASAAMAQAAELDRQFEGDVDVPAAVAGAAKVRGALAALGVDKSLPALDRVDRLDAFRAAAATPAGARAQADQLLAGPRNESKLQRQLVRLAWRPLASGDVDALLAPRAGGDPRAVELLALLSKDDVLRPALLGDLVAAVAASPADVAPRRWALLGAVERPDVPLPPAARFNAALATLKQQPAHGGDVDEPALAALASLAAANAPVASPAAATLLSQIKAARAPAPPAAVGGLPALLKGESALKPPAVGFSIPVRTQGTGRMDLRVEFARVGDNRYVSTTEVPVLLLQALANGELAAADPNAVPELPFADVKRSKADGIWGPVTWLPTGAAASARPGALPVKLKVGGRAGSWVSDYGTPMTTKPPFAGGDAAPSWMSPLTFVPAASARTIAARCGFTLPTSADWANMTRDLSADAPLQAYNLRDQTWNAQASAVTRQNGIEPEGNRPSRFSYSRPEDVSRYYNWSDGTLFFTNVDVGPQDRARDGAGLVNLIGNVAEYVADESGGKVTYGIVGGSALSEPAASLGALKAIVPVADERESKNRADVGFRLAFTAAPAVEASATASKQKPADVIREAPFLAVAVDAASTPLKS